MVKKSVKQMTDAERLCLNGWKRAVCLMYRALADAKNTVADKDRRVCLLTAAAYADSVLGALPIMRGRSGATKIRISQTQAVELWDIENDAIKTLQKRYELNGVDAFRDTGARVFPLLRPQPAQGFEADDRETF